MTTSRPDSRLHIVTKDLLFVAAWEEAKAPRSCAAIKKLLPLRAKLVQTRWSGEAAWISIDHLDLSMLIEDPHQLRQKRL